MPTRPSDRVVGKQTLLPWWNVVTPASTAPFDPGRWPTPARTASIFDAHAPTSHASFAVSHYEETSVPTLKYGSSYIREPVSAPYLHTWSPGSFGFHVFPSDIPIYPCPTP